MTFWVLTSFAPVPVLGDVAWSVDPLSKTLSVDNIFEIEVVIIKTYGQIEETLAVNMKDDKALAVVSKERTESNDRVTYHIKLKANKSGTHMVSLNLFGTYIHNGTVMFNQSKTVVVTVVDSEIN